MGTAKPIVFDPKKEKLGDFKKKHKVDLVIDAFSEQLEELFLIRNPKYRFGGDFRKEQSDFVADHSGLGNWFYFPWSRTLIHFLPEDLHLELRTARNRNIITNEEQQKFYNSKIGVAGLSVGSHGALTVAMTGGAKFMRLADPDKISGSNLNRIRSGFSTIGMNKHELVTNLIYEMNPYSQLDVFPQGIMEKNAEKFVSGLDVLVEEVDHLETKFLLRALAKKHKVPVIMATDNGDNVIADIERYDQDKNLLPFNGAVGDLSPEDIRKAPKSEIPKLATKIAGPGFIVERMKMSLMEVGKTLYSWPQPGTAATMSGVVIAYLARKIIVGDKLPSGKWEINLDKVFGQL